MRTISTFQGSPIIPSPKTQATQFNRTISHNPGTSADQVHFGFNTTRAALVGVAGLAILLTACTTSSPTYEALHTAAQGTVQEAKVLQTLEPTDTNHGSETKYGFKIGDTTYYLRYAEGLNGHPSRYTLTEYNDEGYATGWYYGDNQHDSTATQPICVSALLTSSENVLTGVQGGGQHSTQDMPLSECKTDFDALLTKIKEAL